MRYNKNARASPGVSFYPARRQHQSGVQLRIRSRQRVPAVQPVSVNDADPRGYTIKMLMHAALLLCSADS